MKSKVPNLISRLEWKCKYVWVSIVFVHKKTLCEQTNTFGLSEYRTDDEATFHDPIRRIALINPMGSSFRYMKSHAHWTHDSWKYIPYTTHFTTFHNPKKTFLEEGEMRLRFPIMLSHDFENFAGAASEWVCECVDVCGCVVCAVRKYNNAF